MVTYDKCDFAVLDFLVSRVLDHFECNNDCLFSAMAADFSITNLPSSL